ncbi:MAG: hypothetical protein JO296_15145 [Pseudonocardiales bacterium]|nr:hypothetical protein [Pseudonocardiales bacterium]MBV9651456.1 hypothetical protein [Pseudonocardiales bacterium]
MNRRVSGARARFVAATVAAFATAVAVSACGSPSSSSPAAESTTQSQSSPPPRGTVAAVTATDIEVQNPRTGPVRVTFTPSTNFTKTVTATFGDLAVGDCAFATGPAAQPAGTHAGPLTATSVLISPATRGGTCLGRGAGAGGGRGRTMATSGKITSVNGSGFVIQEGTANTIRTVATTATTAFTKTVTTDKSGLSVGRCVTVMGPSDGTGTVAASSISVRQPGPNGCLGGFGGPGRANRSAAGGNGS